MVTTLTVLIGNLIKTVRQKDKFLVNQGDKLRVIGKCLLIIVLLIGALNFQLIYNSFDRTIPTTKSYSTTDVPTYSDISVIYFFDLHWADSYQLISGVHRISLPTFGNISFHLSETFNVTIVDSTEANENSKVTLKPLSLDNDETSGTESQEPFNALGLLFLPNEGVNGETWQQLITSYLNDSYPFRGFKPTVNLSVTSIPWTINNKPTYLDVNTITYQSNDNGSFFTFSFDKKSGWLLQASLVLDGISWTRDDLYLNNLTITRYFLFNTIENPFEYKMVDDIISVTFMTIIALVFIGSMLYYYKKSKSKDE